MKKEIKIALIACAALVVLFFGLNFLKGLNLFTTDTNYYITFKNISGLSNSSPIYADGYRVGTVKDIFFDYDQKEDIKVLVGLDRSLRIPKGSRAEIESDMLGNLQVNLLLANNPRERIEAGGVIEGSVSSGMLGKLGGMVPALEKMLPKLDSIMASLNTLLADPAIAQTLHHAEAVSGNLITTTNQLNTLVGQLNKNVPSIMTQANSVLGNTTQITDNLNKQLANVDINTTMTKVNATLDNVEQLTKQLNNPQGSIGLLMRDPQLYNNLNTTMADVDSLLNNLRAHPKRYVHFSLFGKKDK